MKKRLLALALALILTLGLFSITALADGGTVADTSWYTGHESDTEYVLNDAEDLLGFAQLVNNGTCNFEDKPVKLGADIDLTGIEWTPIGGLDGSKPFRGTFDGQDHTISNLTMHLGDKGSAKIRMGLFSYTEIATLQNVTLKNFSFSATGSNIRAGALSANVWYGTKGTNPWVGTSSSNVTVDGFTFTGNADIIGGLIGFKNDTWGSIENCTVKNVRFDLEIESSNKVIGGFIGILGTTIDTVINCHVEGFDATITDNSNSGSEASTVVGGFTGSTQTRDSKVVFNDCSVSDLDITVIGNVDAAGFVDCTGAAIICDNCKVSGVIDASGVTNSTNLVGGFVGDMGFSGRKKTRAENQTTDCTADVDIISGGATAGGFVATTSIDNTNTITCENCAASGDVTNTAEGGVAGGFAGSVDRGTYENCTATGKVNGDTNGALIGANNASTPLDLVVLTLEPNDGSVTTRIAQATGGTVDLSTHTPSRSGYRFAGWFTDTDCTVQSEDTVTLTQDVTLYAKWEKIDDFAWLLPVLGALDKEPFDDVKTGDWFYDDVQYAYDNGLMTGTGTRTFSPDAPVTRGMVMTILARREGIMTDRYSPWYAAGVEWAVVNGISDGSNPEAEITREQLAAMLYRYAKLKGYDLSGVALTGYADANSVSTYAVSAMQWAVGSGLMNGSNGRLTPRDTATRAQLAAMLHRFFD